MKEKKSPSPLICLFVYLLNKDCHGNKDKCCFLLGILLSVCRMVCCTFCFSPDSLRTECTGSMTTSSEQVLPSPTKIRARKSRHRRNNSRGSSKDVASPVKSPTRDVGGGAEGESSKSLHPQSIVVNHVHHDDHVSPSSFRYLGPATAIREQHTEDEHEAGEGSAPTPDHPSDPHGNMNDVCFGCDGGCSDATCSSKRSSQISADVESSCDSLARSPMRPGTHQDILPSLGTLIDDPTAISPTETTSNMSESQTKPVREKDSNENLNCPSDDIMHEMQSTVDSPGRGKSKSPTPSENSGSNLAVKRGSDQDGAPKRTPPLMHRVESVDSEPNENRRTPGVKFRNIKVKILKKKGNVQLNSNMVSILMLSQESRED